MEKKDLGYACGDISSDDKFKDALDYIFKEKEYLPEQSNDEIFEDALCFIESDSHSRDDMFKDALAIIQRDNDEQNHNITTKKFACRKCTLTFDNENERNVHEKKGHIARDIPLNNENIMKKKQLDSVAEGNQVGKGSSTQSNPVAGCSSYRCEKCAAIFDHRQERDIHERYCSMSESENSHSQSPSSNESSQNGESFRQYRCHHCNDYFLGRRALCLHKNISHQDGAGQLQSKPWGDNADPFINVPRENEIRNVYNNNRIYILAPHREIIRKKKNEKDLVKKVYNFPVNDGVTDSDIQSHLEYIYSLQNTTFKINFTAGVILESTEEQDGELRYFKPSANVSAMEQPLTVWNYESLIKAIERMQELNITEFVRTLKPNSKYRVRFITQIEYYVYSTKYLLGSHVDLPGYIKAKKCIFTRTKDARGRDYECNLCFFTALAQFKRKHEGLSQMRNVIPLANELLEKWHSHLVSLGVEQVTFNRFRERFSGVDSKYFPDLEDCFQISINVFSLSSKDECNVIYLSTKKFDEVIYLNQYTNHINLIMNFNQYASRFTCQACNKMFKTLQTLKRHGSSCMWKTKYIYPGGYYKHKVSIFEELEEIGIYVPEDERAYDFFAVWDMESILEQVPIVEGKKLSYTHIHKPVSCSIASNVPGHTSPYCIVNKEQQELVKDMFDKFLQIWEKATALAYKKWGMYVDFLKQKIDDTKNQLEEEIEECPNIGPGKSLTDEEIQQLNEDLSQINDSEVKWKKQQWQYDMHKSIRENGVYPSKTLINQLCCVCEKFEKYLQQFIILSFNGSRYDCPLIKGELCRYLFLQQETGERSFVTNVNEGSDDDDEEEEEEEIRCDIYSMGPPAIIKKGSHYTMISNTYFKFLDITNYLPPGTSYANFLKSFEIEEKKFYFPYEYLTSFEKLNETSLPDYPSEAWFSTLKNVDLLHNDYDQWEKNGQNGHPPFTGEENYAMIRRTWQERGWQTMKDYLIYYNNCDTLPFVSAVKKLIQMYLVQSVDIFKQTISVPGLARIRMMSYAKRNGVLFSIFDKQNRDLYHMFKSQLVAGPSIIFTRYQEVGLTPLRPFTDQICKSIYGYDVNSLYLYCIGGQMPTGDIVRRAKDNNFLPSYNTRYSMMYSWLRHMECEDGVKIMSKVTNGRECKIGPFFVDGMAILPNGKTRIYEFNGCYWHRHNCLLCKKLYTEEDRKIYERTIAREKFLKKCGFEVKSIWECEFRELQKSHPALDNPFDFISPFTRKNRKSVTEHELIQGVMNGDLCGFMLVDIEVPEDRKDEFCDFPPLFTNQIIGEEIIGKYVL